MSDDEILRIDGLSRTFQGFRAVDGVSLGVRRGTIHAVIGPNGAGKSTLFRLVSGQLRSDGGTVRLDGRDVTNLPPHRMARLGVGHAFQLTNVFPGFTVAESIELAVHLRERRSRRVLPYPRGRVLAHVEEVLTQTGLWEHRAARASELSHGDQRSLEVALALAMRPNLLLLDEPTAGMAPHETSRMVGLIEGIAAESNVTILFCEHDVPTVFGVANRITVMHQGRVLVEGAPEEIRGHPEVRDVYLGAGW